MKRLSGFFLCAVLVLPTIPALAGHHEGDCKANGSWYGYDEYGSIWWTSTVDGQSASRGTLNLEIPGSVNFFEGSFSITEMKGQWKKKGGGAYDWTAVGFPFDEGLVVSVKTSLVSSRFKSSRASSLSPIFTA